MTGRLYKFAVLLSFLILIFVQLSLIYNTYTLRDRDFNLKEKTLLNDEYGRSIPDDKVYKGGGRIVDSILSKNMPDLRRSYLTDREAFKKLSKSVSVSLLKTLRRNSSMDSVFRSIVRRNRLDTNLRFLLTFQSIEINFDPGIGDVYVFDSRRDKFLERELQTPYGIIIDGSLNNPAPQNRVTNLSVSGALNYDFRVTFSLFADHPNRFLKVAMQMLPTFSLAALCIVIIIGINYYTYRNWMRQKKEAELKSDFLNSIKHEFNTPITTILVASKSLDEEEVLNDKGRVKALVSIVERQARRLHSHINQMLEVSVVGGKVNFQEMDLNRAILMRIEDYKIRLEKTDTLTFDPFPAELLVSMDSFLFTTMLNNMLDNAFKHNQSEVKRTSLSIEEQSGNFVLHIRDNGKGIEEVAKERIFDKFFRSNRDTATGLGLGLFYVKQCMDIHGWTINLKTELGTGTEFMICIPKHLVKIEE